MAAAVQSEPKLCQGHGWAGCRWVIGLLCLMSLSARAYTLDFPGINGASVFGGGQTFSFATGGSIWDVTVTGVAHGFTPVWGTDINDTSKQVLSDTNLSASIYTNPTWPNTTGVFFGHLNATPSTNSVDLTFNFVRVSGTDPLVMYVHNGESEDETSTITTTGSSWQAGPAGNVTSTYTGTTAQYVGSVTDGGAVGYWAAFTTFSSGSGVVSWNYTAPPSGVAPSDMIAFETNVSPIPEPSTAMLTATGLCLLLRRRRGLHLQGRFITS